MANDFGITASDTNGDIALEKLGLKVSLKDDKATLTKYKELAKYKGADDEATKVNMQSLIDDEVEKQRKAYKEQYDSLTKTKADAQEAIDKIKEKYKDSPLDSSDAYKTLIEAKEEELKAEGLSEDEKKTLEEELKALKEKKADADTLEAKEKVVEDAGNKLQTLEKSFTSPTDDNPEGALTADAVKKIEASFVAQANYATEVVAAYEANPDAVSGTGATKVNAQDAIIYLNGAEFTNTSNVFEINGLTITALNQTKEGEDVTITTQNDVSGIYDMVKNFLKEYNSVINEIDKLYNSASIGTMKPMTSEEKEAVSESEAEEWEKKLRDSSLRRDSNLSSISEALKSAMSASFTINGKEMSLSDFGIGTLGYFEAADNEKNMYHIDGDSDDESTSGKADKLKSLISSDPNTVVSFFTQLGQKLYSNMSDISKSVDGYRSFGSFYDDKKMKTDYTEYNSKIAELEEKMNDYEDKWYAKFAKMETAMAKMQSNTSAVSALLGGS